MVDDDSGDAADPVVASEEWADKLRQTCGHYYAIPHKRQREVAGDIHLNTSNGLEIADLSSDIHHIERTRRGISQDDMEYFFLIIQKSGETRIDHAGHSTLLRAGDSLLMDSTKEAVLTNHTKDMHILSIHLPRNEFFADCAGSPDVGQCLDSSHPMSQALRSQFSRFLVPPVSHQEWLDSDEPTPANRTLLFDMIRLAFTQRSSVIDAARLSSARNRFEMAVDLIEHHLVSDSLCLEWLARRLDMSTRQLQREFRQHDTSFSNTVKKKRLSLAASKLRRRSYGVSASSVSSIALDAGFRDLSNFNHSFKSQFGMSPREYIRYRSDLGNAIG